MCSLVLFWNGKIATFGGGLVDAPLVHDRRGAQVVERLVERALDVVLVEPGRERLGVDGRIVGAADDLFSAAGRGQREEDDGERAEKGGEGAEAKLHGAMTSF